MEKTEWKNCECCNKLKKMPLDEIVCESCKYKFEDEKKVKE